ncbi:hypothetical protein PRIC2_001750 [Phytophthora ramorum]
MYATLDIERDDSSDTDFIPDDADEAGDDDRVSDDSEESANLGHTGKMQATKKSKTSGSFSAAQHANRQYSPHQTSPRRRFSPHEPSPSKKRKEV